MDKMFVYFMAHESLSFNVLALYSCFALLIDAGCISYPDRFNGGYWQYVMIDT